MIKATIHQPYFLPWLGYFTKLSYSNYFVVLDDVNYRDRFYHKRAQFLNSKNQKEYLSLKVGHNYNVKLNEVTFNFEKKKFIRKSIKTLEQSYSKFPYFKEEWTSFKLKFELIISHNNKLVDINLEIIKYFLGILNLNNLKILYSSKILDNIEYSPTERYYHICKKYGISTIVTGSGKSLKIHDIYDLMDNDINIEVQYFNKVKSKFRSSVPDIDLNLSIIHYLFLIGRFELEKLIKHKYFQPKLISR